MVQMFATIGIGQWFRYLTGSLEVLGAVLLLIPPAAGYAAAMLTAVMAGVVFTHLFVIGANAALAIALLIAVIGVAWFRKTDPLTGQVSQLREIILYQPKCRSGNVHGRRGES